MTTDKVRLTYWLSGQERAQVLDCAVRAWERTLATDTANTLKGVITELDVAAARALFNSGTIRVGQAKDGPGGETVDTKPVCLSAHELDAVLALDGLPDTVRARFR